MKKEIWREITAEERNIVLKHFREQYEAICDICGKDSEEAEESKAIYKKVLSEPLENCWDDIECFYGEMLDTVRVGIDVDNDMVQMIKKVLEIPNIFFPGDLNSIIADEEKRLSVGNPEFMARYKKIMDMRKTTQKADGGFGEMKSEINRDVRKENYECGIQNGDKVYCGQDLKNLIGFRISDVTSDENDMNVIMWLEDETKMIAVYFDNMCLDGESISTIDHTEADCGYLLRPVTDEDLKEISSMTSYCDSELVDEDKELVGVNHIYCNDIKLEGTEQFEIKNLYVFKNGQIMTKK